MEIDKEDFTRFKDEGIFDCFSEITLHIPAPTKERCCDFYDYSRHNEKNAAAICKMVNNLKDNNREGYKRAEGYNNWKDRDPIKLNFVEHNSTDGDNLIRLVTADGRLHYFPTAIREAIKLSKSLGNVPVKFNFNFGPITVCGNDDPVAAFKNYHKKVNEEREAWRQEKKAAEEANAKIKALQQKLKEDADAQIKELKLKLKKEAKAKIEALTEELKNANKEATARPQPSDHVEPDNMPQRKNLHSESKTPRYDLICEYVT